jgi:hypothetical protein
MFETLVEIVVPRWEGEKGREEETFVWGADAK